MTGGQSSIPPDPAIDPIVLAGIGSTPLIADPSSWINRRVETVELLASEETRRRVSIDFTLDPAQQDALTITDGVVVPISVLTKEPRRNFDLRDESGKSVPVLGKAQNADLAHFAVLSAVWDALPTVPSDDLLQSLAADLEQIVASPASTAEDALSFFIGSAERGDPTRKAIMNDATCATLLSTLWQHYVLYAVLAPGGPNRRVLKYSYGEAFEFERVRARLRDRVRPRELRRRALRPDRLAFAVECPGAWRARSFHLEVAIPEELRCEQAYLVDATCADAKPLGQPDLNADRVSLYAPEALEAETALEARVRIATERPGRVSHAAATSFLVSALLWLGVVSGLDAENKGAAVSILLAGAAFFSGVTAGRGEHKLVKILFFAQARWLGVVTLAALTASGTLAMEYPCASPVQVWALCAAGATVALIRLGWTALRAPK